MRRRPPASTSTDPLFPYTTPLRSEDRRRRRADAAEAEGREGLEILHLHHRQGENDEQGQRQNLDDDEDRVDRRRFPRADPQQTGDRKSVEEAKGGSGRDDHGGRRRIKKHKKRKITHNEAKNKS